MNIGLVALALSFVASSSTLLANSMGFSGSLRVDSVSASDRKIVFVFDGPCEVLINKQKDAAGSNAQSVKTILDRGVLILQRTGGNFPTEEAWQAECRFCEKTVGGFVQLDASSVTLTWSDGDLVLVQAQQVKIGVAED